MSYGSGCGQTPVSVAVGAGGAVLGACSSRVSELRLAPISSCVRVRAPINMCPRVLAGVVRTPLPCVGSMPRFWQHFSLCFRPNNTRSALTSRSQRGAPVATSVWRWGNSRLSVISWPGSTPGAPASRPAELEVREKRPTRAFLPYTSQMTLHWRASGRPA